MDNEETTQFDLCRQALESLSQGAAWNFKDTVENILSAKIMDGIETERFNVGSSMFDEGRMPASVIKSKERLASMSDEELAKHHGDKDENALRQMAWRHGYGKMSPHYVNRIKKAKG